MVMSKYEPDIVKEINDNLELGMTRTDTCDLVGICYETFMTWQKKHPEFLATIKKSEQKCKKRCIGIIQKAAVTTWQAAAWWLERKHRNEYALRQEIGGWGNNDAIKIEVKYV